MQKRETFARTLAVRSTRLIRLTCFILLLSTQTLAKADYETTLCDKLLYNKAELKSFAQWISSHGPTDPVMSYPLTPKSFGTILTGNERDHLLQVRQIINCSEIFYYKEVSNWLVLDAKAFQAEQRIESSEEQQRDINEVVFRWLADRVYVVEKTAGHAATNDEAELELEWSVVYIVNAETLTTFQVNDLLSKLWNKRLCQLQSLTVKRVEGMEIRCSKLALFFSTSIGSEKVIVRFDSKNGKSDMDQNANHQNVQDFIFKKVRTLWPKGIIYSSYRRLVSIVHGRIEEETVYKLMQEQAQRRADSQQALPTTISSTSPSTGTIQLDVFEKAGFIGQEPVIAAVKQALSSVKSGLKLSNGPLIFLFAGLPGTGKTFLSQLIAMAYNYDVEVSWFSFEAILLSLRGFCRNLKGKTLAISSTTSGSNIYTCTWIWATIKMIGRLTGSLTHHLGLKAKGYCLRCSQRLRSSWKVRPRVSGHEILGLLLCWMRSKKHTPVC